MQTTLQLATWGGSTALRIPKNFLQQLGIADKSTVIIKTTDNNELVITPVYRHKTLDERFAEWNGDKYELTDEDREWLDMKSVGEEEC
jgi:antitoxin MazE